ncbi:polysaccharide deacetylase family protein [Lapidilactobacillus luobeiensis]|uniref:polysaccharide deacetylase family protein n=1 Tax=Lapidilactobacillus luobeiensis TaxID=2950371 RepID=UPI0021C45938|nr:polysaccharide deacetylase family protein [Lapidilactobacillus luobeiensis]
MNGRHQAKTSWQKHRGKWLAGILGVIVIMILGGVMIAQGQAARREAATQRQVKLRAEAVAAAKKEKSARQSSQKEAAAQRAAAKSSSEAAAAASSSSQQAAETASSQSSSSAGATSSTNTSPATTTQASGVTTGIGQNHTPAASSYAFDVAQIRAVMNGQASYTGRKTVFLTFDDGIDLTTTPQILAILQRYQVHATFFLVGKSLGPRTQALLQQEYQAGHGLAIHSFYHDYGRLYPNRRGNAAQILAEAEQTQAALRQYLGAQFSTRVWRYPGGHMSWQNLAPADQALSSHGYHWMDWNAASGDAMSAAQAPKNVAEMVQYQAHSLSYYPDHGVRVVLMHDAASKQLTVDALPKIIEFYQQAGYQFGILS